MARLKCTECGASVSKADPVCRSCGSSLLEDGATTEIPLAAQPLVSVPSLQPTADAAPDRTPAQCPNPDCGADIPDPRNLVCIECMTELRPAGPQTASLPHLAYLAHLRHRPPQRATTGTRQFTSGAGPGWLSASTSGMSSCPPARR